MTIMRRLIREVAATVWNLNLRLPVVEQIIFLYKSIVVCYCLFLYIIQFLKLV